MESDAFSPPVNNALLPDIYNKLDAELQERTRVINSQLDKRLLIQEKVLKKNQRALERHHNEEAIRMRQELARISTCLPAVGNIKNFCLGYFTRSKKEAKKVRGIPEEKVDLPFCERHFIHHLPTKRRFYKKSARTLLPPVRGESVSGMGPMGGRASGVRNTETEEVIHDVQLRPGAMQRVFPMSR